MALIAVIYPLLLFASEVSLFPQHLRHSPTQLEARPGSLSADAPLLTKEQTALFNLIFLAVWVFVALIGGLPQFLLFRLAHDKSALFSVRATDIWPYSFLVGLFLGFLLAPFPFYYLLKRIYADKFSVLMSSRTNSSSYGIGTLAGEGWKPSVSLAFTIALSLTALNLGLYETFLTVQPGRISYKHLLSLRQSIRDVADVDRGIIYTRDRAPNGNTCSSCYTLILEFSDSSFANTSHLLEDWQISLLLQALATARGRPVPIEYRNEFPPGR